MKQVERMVGILLSIVLLFGAIPMSAEAALGGRDWKWPVPATSTISSCYGEQRTSGTHYALDISAGGGASIYASYSGEVIYTFTGCPYDSAKPNATCSCGKCGDLGNSVYIRHSYNGASYVSRYGHLRSVNVSVGQKVTKDTVIGTVGSTGGSTGNHLDFMIYKGTSTSVVKGRDCVDPFKDEFLELPVGFKANAGTSCCYTYVDEVKAQYSNTEHTCNKGTYKWYGDVHPHYKCYQCSVCGEINAFYDETSQVNTCEECRPGKPVLNVKVDNGGAAMFTWGETSNTTHYNVWISKKEADGNFNWDDRLRLYKVETGFVYILEPGEYCANLLAYSSEMWEPDKSDWAHTWADDVYFSVEENTKVTFNANGGTLQKEILSDTIDGVNIGRPSEALVVFIGDMSSPETNLYGAEVAVNSNGQVVEVRKLGDENQLSIPAGGFVLSGHAKWDETSQQHIGGFVFIDSIIKMYEANPGSVYIGLNYENSEVKVFDSYEGYITNHKYLTIGETYGSLPRTGKEGYLFDGWFTEAIGGTEVKWDSSYSASELYAHWVSVDEAEPSATLVDSENNKCYERYDYIMSWEEAEAFCESKGGHLVAINSLEEQELFVNIGFLDNTRRGQYSIGATDREEEGKWMWVTAEAAEFTNWDQDVPENNGGTRENYAVMIATPYSPYYTVGEWLDVNNTDMNGYHSSCNTGFICEYDTACNHNYQKNTTNPTCTKQGYTTYTCKICGDSYTDSEKAALGHKYGNWTTDKSATCEGAGSEKRVCERCNNAETRTVAAKGHTYETVVTAPSCTETGYSTHTCKNCKDSYTDSETDSLGHKLGDWTTVKEATCQTVGTEKRTCERCDYEEIQKTSASNHNYKTVVMLPTCEEGGYSIYTCRVCEHSYEGDETSALGHSFTNYISDNNATEDFPGTKTAKCDRCNATDTIPETSEEVPETPASKEVIRLAGDTRYDTGYAVADVLKETLGVDKFEAVVVATGKNFADALAGSYLAVQKNAPIILTNGNADNVARLHEYIKANVIENGTVYILGGEAAVPETVEDISGYTVKRLAGDSRYDTNLEILLEAGISGDEIIVATGKSFADSLSASAAKLPILLVKPNATLDIAQKALLKNMNKIYIVGGEGAVSSEYEAELAAYGTVERVFGSSRYDTSVEIAKAFCGSVDKIVVASGKNFPDGLCGGSLAAALNVPLVLTRDNGADAAAGYAQENAVVGGYVLGGTGALTDDTVTDVFELQNAQEIK